VEARGGGRGGGRQLVGVRRRGMRVTESVVRMRVRRHRLVETRVVGIAGMVGMAGAKARPHSPAVAATESQANLLLIGTKAN
jgi:hypothetical protein